MRSQEASRKFRQADVLFRGGKYDAALALLDELYKSYPNNQRLMFPRALALAKLGRLREAIAICDALIARFRYQRAVHLRNTLLQALQAHPDPPDQSIMPVVDLDHPVFYTIKHRPIEVETPFYKRPLFIGAMGVVAVLLVIGVVAMGRTGATSPGTPSTQASSSAEPNAPAAMPPGARTVGSALKEIGLRLVLAIVLLFIVLTIVPLYIVLWWSGKLPEEPIEIAGVAGYALLAVLIEVAILIGAVMVIFLGFAVLGGLFGIFGVLMGIVLLIGVIIGAIWLSVSVPRGLLRARYDMEGRDFLVLAVVTVLLYVPAAYLVKQNVFSGKIVLSTFADVVDDEGKPLGDEYAAKPVPAATIVVDGSYEDWTSVPDVYSSEYPDNVVKAVKVAQDGSNFYAMVQLGAGFQSASDQQQARASEARPRNLCKVQWASEEAPEMLYSLVFKTEEQIATDVDGTVITFPKALCSLFSKDMKAAQEQAAEELKQLGEANKDLNRNLMWNMAFNRSRVEMNSEAARAAAEAAGKSMASLFSAGESVLDLNSEDDWLSCSLGQDCIEVKVPLRNAGLLGAAKARIEVIPSFFDADFDAMFEEAPPSSSGPTPGIR